LNARIDALTARRVALQARIALQRDDAVESLRTIASGAARVDHTVASLRRLAPLALLAGAVGLLVLGPSRAVGLLRRGLTVALYVTQARRLLG
jgi:YqjK-like protein